jgi:hypothetical protein
MWPQLFSRLDSRGRVSTIPRIFRVKFPHLEMTVEPQKYGEGTARRGICEQDTLNP